MKELMDEKMNLNLDTISNYLCQLGVCPDVTVLSQLRSQLLPGFIPLGLDYCSMRGPAAEVSVLVTRYCISGRHSCGYFGKEVFPQKHLRNPSLHSSLPCNNNNINSSCHACVLTVHQVLEKQYLTWLPANPKIGRQIPPSSKQKQRTKKLLQQSLVTAELGFHSSHSRLLSQLDGGLKVISRKIIFNYLFMWICVILQ